MSLCVRSASSSDEANLQINDARQATALSPGLVWVAASTAFASSKVPVLIRPGSRPIQTDIEWENDQHQLRPDGTLTSTSGGVGAVIDSIGDTLFPTVYAQTSGGDSNDFMYEKLWSEPRNLVGSPRNCLTDSSIIGTGAS